jgi:TP901 family phage tail tape measure protein
MVEAGTISSEVRIALDKLKGDITQVEAEFDKLGKSTESSSKKQSDTWSKSFDVTKLAGVAAFAAISVAVVKSIETFSKFEDSMAQVHAVMTGTEADFAKLEDAALDLASSTQYTAEEASKALYTFSRFGKTAEESVLLLNQAQLLAGSTGSELAESSTLLIQVMNQFGIAADDAGRIVNVLAAAKMPVSEFSSTLAAIGPVAKGMNIPLEQIVAVMRTLTLTGMESGQATQALKIILGDLSDSASPIVKKLEEMGVGFDQINPKTNDFAGIIGNLEKAGLGAADMMAIFGNRAGPVMVNLLSQGQAKLDAYTKSITGTDEAARQYAIRNDSLADRMKGLSATLEVLQIKFAKEFAPAMKGGVDLLQGFIKWLTDIPAPLKLLIGTIAVGVPVILGLGAAFKVISGLLAGFGGPLAIAALAITAVIGGVLALSKAFDSFGNTQENLTRSTEKLRKTNSDLDEIYKRLKESGDNLNDTEKVMLEQRAKLLEQSLAYQLAGEVKAIDDAKNNISDMNKHLAAQEALFKEIETTGTASAESWRAVYGAWGSKGSANADWLIKLGEQIGETTQQIDTQTQTIDEGILSLVESVEAGRIAIPEIEKYSMTIAGQVQWLIKKRIEQTQANAATVAAAKAEEEAAESRRRAQQATEDYAKGMWSKVTALIEGEKTELQKLQERYAELERYKWAGVDMEKKRAEALIILGQKIADEQLRIQEEREAAEQEAHDLEVERMEELARKEQEKIDKIYAGAQALQNAFSGLFSAIAENQSEALDKQMQAELVAAGVAEESTIARLQRERDEAILAGDAELQAKKEKELKSAQITLEFEKKKAQIRYEAEMASWVLTLAMATAEGARAIINGFMSIPFLPVGLAMGALATTLTGLQLATIGLSKPQPPSFATGGIVLPSSGGTMVNVAENQGAEVLFNTRAEGQAFINQMGAAIGRVLSASGQRGHFTLQLITDGRQTAETVAEYFNNGVVRVKI